MKPKHRFCTSKRLVVYCEVFHFKGYVAWEELPKECFEYPYLLEAESFAYSSQESSQHYQQRVAVFPVKRQRDSNIQGDGRRSSTTIWLRCREHKLIYYLKTWRKPGKSSKDKARPQVKKASKKTESTYGHRRSSETLNITLNSNRSKRIC